MVTELSTTNSTYRPQLTALGSITYADLAVAESVTVGVQVLDAQGNFLAFATPAVSTGSGTVAAMLNLPDSTAVPGNTLFKAQIIGKAACTTTAIIQAAGIADTFTVKVQ